MHSGSRSSSNSYGAPDGATLAVRDSGPSPVAQPRAGEATLARLRALATGHFTGRIDVVGQADTCSLVLLAGRLAEVETIGDALGAYLVGRGLIDELKRRAVHRVACRAAVPTSQILAACGLLDREALRAARIDLRRTAALHALSDLSAEWHERPGAIPSGLDDASSLDLEVLVHDLQLLFDAGEVTGSAHVGPPPSPPSATDPEVSLACLAIARKLMDARHYWTALDAFAAAAETNPASDATWRLYGQARAFLHYLLGRTWLPRNQILRRIERPGHGAPLGPAEARFLACFDRPRSIAEVIASTSWPELDALLALRRLEREGYLAPHHPGEPPTPHRR